MITSAIAGKVAKIVREDLTRQELIVETHAGERVAYSYPDLIGLVQVGEKVQLNTWAVGLELGTGGFDFVICREGVTMQASEPPGHVMKLRYTPHQRPVLAAESQESPHHSVLAECDSLEGAPVVCAELHSQLPAIAAAAKWETQGAARVVYVMTDSAALPIALSNLVRELKDKKLIDATVTAGQALGGDFEAVNLYSALIVARKVAKADIIIVSQGPGSVGTGTKLGFSGIDQGIALNAASSLDGTAIAAARLSFSDSRKRHLGLSHHTLTVLQQIALLPALVPLPRLSVPDQYYLRKYLESEELPSHQQVVVVDAQPGLEALEKSGIHVTTMKRRITEDSAFFLAAAAAGLLAGQWSAKVISGSTCPS